MLSLVAVSAFASVSTPPAPFVTPLSCPSALSSLLLPTEAKSALTAKHCAKPAHVANLTAYLVRNMRATRADPAVAMAAIARCAQATPPSPPAAPRTPRGLGRAARAVKDLRDADVAVLHCHTGARVAARAARESDGGCE